MRCGCRRGLSRKYLAIIANHYHLIKPPMLIYACVADIASSGGRAHKPAARWIALFFTQAQPGLVSVAIYATGEAERITVVSAV